MFILLNCFLPRSIQFPRALWNFPFTHYATAVFTGVFFSFFFSSAILFFSGLRGHLKGLLGALNLIRHSSHTISNTSSFITSTLNLSLQQSTLNLNFEIFRHLRQILASLTFSWSGLFFVSFFVLLYQWQQFLKLPQHRQTQNLFLALAKISLFLRFFRDFYIGLFPWRHYDVNL